MECAVVGVPLRRAEAEWSGLAFWRRKTPVWVPSDEMVMVLGKWGREMEREQELEGLVATADAWVRRLEEATGVVTGPATGDCGILVAATRNRERG